MSKNSLGVFGVVAFACLAIASVAGWIMNIAAIVHAVSDPITGMFIARCVGIFVAPLGAVLGYF